MKAYLLYTDKPYLVYGEDSVDAGTKLAKMLGIEDIEQFNLNGCSVGGSWDINEPIPLYKLWPYFTCFPPEGYLK